MFQQSGCKGPSCTTSLHRVVGWVHLFQLYSFASIANLCSFLCGPWSLIWSKSFMTNYVQDSCRWAGGVGILSEWMISWFTHLLLKSNCSENSEAGRTPPFPPAWGLFQYGDGEGEWKYRSRCSSPASISPSVSSLLKTSCSGRQERKLHCIFSHLFLSSALQGQRRMGGGTRWNPTSRMGEKLK